MMRLGHAIILVVALAAGLATVTCSQKPFMRFQHAAHVGRGVGCTNCHAGVFDQKTAHQSLPTPEKCANCHALPHPKKDYKGSCDDCHSVIVREAKVGLERSAPLTFNHPTHLKKNRGQCFPCHKELVTRANHVERVRPTMSSCFTCHNHKKQWDNLECGACHSNLRQYPLQPVSQFAHEGDFGRQHGKVAANRTDLCQQCHTESYCANCHIPSQAVVRPSTRFPQAIEKGFIHRGDFLTRHSLDARGSGDTCLRCHAQNECSSCHEKNGVAAGSKRSPHAPGWVSISGGGNQHGRAARREIVTCAGCHDKGAASNCVTCHKPGGPGGNPHPPGWKTRQKQSDRVCKVCHG
ncbi:MAG: hypothetical protein HYY84_19850 [Deltaproteobacteria bacterium]|nr:hypothetical protein [Deltaproteobacteria bacterium]